MCQNEEIFPLPRSIVTDDDISNLFLMKVHDNAMAGDGIRDGDWAVVSECQPVDDGDAVAVMIDGDAAVRIFQDWGSAEAIVLGKVVSVIHQV